MNRSNLCHFIPCVKILKIQKEIMKLVTKIQRAHTLYDHLSRQLLEVEMPAEVLSRWHTINKYNIGKNSAIS